MGLDAVELILAIEDEFCIKILDAEAGNFVTVGDTVRLVKSKLHFDPDAVCPFQHSFYLVRKALMEQFEIPKEAIKIDTKFDDIFPYEERRQKWRTFCNALPDSLHVNPLRRALWIHRIVFIAIPGITFFAMLWYFSFHMAGYVAGFFSAMLAGFIGAFLTKPFKTHFPAGGYSIIDFIPQRGAWANKKVTEQEIFERIKEITIEQLAVKPEEVTMNARWLHDLGCD